VQADFVGVDGAAAIQGGAAVVVDVMRAFTVAAWALHLGVRQLVLVDDVEEAVAIATTIAGALLCKDGAPDARFDLHNSPHQLLDRDLAGRTIVQRTNAGTRGAVAARGAERLWCASFVNAAATAAALRRGSAEHVTFVVSGGLDAEEDLACAELIAALATGHRPDPGPFVERARRSSAAEHLAEGVRRGFAGIGAQDVAMCLDVDRFAFAMEASTRADRVVLARRGEGA
jgi:2-phosphosulfolactate phosphatase